MFRVLFSITVLGAPSIETDDDRIVIDGAPTFLKGVCYSPFIAGDVPGAPPGRVDFANDLREIRETLHANAVRIYEPLPRAFYDEARRNGLWVLQGFFIPGAPDLLAPTFLAEQRAAIESGVARVFDAGGGDIVLAYVLGSRLPTQSVIDTIRAHPAHPRFQGTFYRTPAAPRLPEPDFYPYDSRCGRPPFEAFPDPHPFQSFLAELADHLASLVKARSGVKPLVGHAITPFNNPFLGTRDRVVPAIDTPVDLSFLDLVFENIFTYETPYLAYHGFPAYLDGLKGWYRRVPVVVLETGYSTSPAGFSPPGPLCGYPPAPLPLSLTFGGVSEALQARAIEERWVDMLSSPRRFAGFFAFGFYDEWWLGGDPSVQNADQPLEFFGIKRVSPGPGGMGFTVSEKPAYWKLAQLYGCEEADADPARCGLAIRSPRALTAAYEVPLDLALEAAGGQPPYRWSVDDPALLPRGVALDAQPGRIAGIPERMGIFRFRLRVEDSAAPPLSRTRLTSLRVGPPVFATRGKEVLKNGKPFFLKGIDYSPFIAGDAPWAWVEMADPHLDLKRIKEELHANAIRLYQTVPRPVYDAARENGLFIIQGIHMQVDGPPPGLCERSEPPRTVDLLEPAFFESMKRHVRMEIDEVHKLGAGDTVLAYAVGNEVSFCAVQRTIEDHQGRPRYQGRHFSAPAAWEPPDLTVYPGCPPVIAGFPDPHPFHSFIAELADLAAAREEDHHGIPRHLMGHATDPNLSMVPDAKDRFFPIDHPPVDAGFLDLVFQNVYSYFPPNIRFLGYREYLVEAEAYYQVPFVVLECGYSTSRGFGVGSCATGPGCGQPSAPWPLSFCFGGNSLEQQARGLEEQFARAMAEPRPVAGFFVFEYFDEWWKGHNLSQFVHDDTPEEHFGLLEVSGTRDDFTVIPKPAFEAVGRMFREAVLFRRGDVDGSGRMNITDAVVLLGALFLGEQEPACRDAADADDSGGLNITDPINVLSRLFLGGDPLPSPGSDRCGVDPEVDSLPACAYPQESCNGGTP